MTIDKHTLKPATLKDLQVELLKLLKIIDKICKENNIQYWLDAGTLLGAVRHKGFIPWDDDIDISIPAADYQRLISALDKETKNNKNIFLHYKSNNLSSGMVERLATTKLMMQRGKKMVACFVDIFPCRIINKIDKKTDIATYNVAQFFRYGRVLNGAKIEKIYKKNSLNSALNAKIEFNTYFQFSYLPNCNKTKDDSIASFSESIRGKNTYFPYTDIFPLKEIEFEGIRSFSPNNVESYLTTVYGNYMELPPVSEQVPKHGHALYFCNSREFVLKSTAKALKKDDISFYRGPIRRFFTELSQILGVREKLRNFDNARRERRYTKKY